MPFTPPTTVASKANTGYLGQLLLGSPLASIAEIKSIKPDVFSVPKVPTTTLVSPNATEEFFPGLKEPGMIELIGNFIGDSSQLSIETLASAQTIFAFQIVIPVQQNTKTYTGTGTGYVAGYTGPSPIENNKAVEFTLKIQMTSTYSEVVA